MTNCTNVFKWPSINLGRALFLGKCTGTQFWPLFTDYYLNLLINIWKHSGTWDTKACWDPCIYLWDPLQNLHYSHMCCGRENSESMALHLWCAWWQRDLIGDEQGRVKPLELLSCTCLCIPSRHQSSWSRERSNAQAAATQEFYSPRASHLFSPPITPFEGDTTWPSSAPGLPQYHCDAIAGGGDHHGPTPCVTLTATCRLGQILWLNDWWDLKIQKIDTHCFRPWLYWD